MKISKKQLRQIISETIYNHPEIGSLDIEKPYTHLQGYESDDKEDQETIRSMGEGDNEWSAHGSFLAGEKWDEMQDMTDDMMQLHNVNNPIPSGKSGPYLHWLDKYEKAMQDIQNFEMSVTNNEGIGQHVLNSLDDNRQAMIFYAYWDGILDRIKRTTSQNNFKDYRFKELARDYSNEFGSQLLKLITGIISHHPLVKKIKIVMERKFKDHMGQKYFDDYNKMPYQIRRQTGMGKPIYEYIFKEVEAALRNSEIGELIDVFGFDKRSIV